MTTNTRRAVSWLASPVLALVAALAAAFAQPAAERAFEVCAEPGAQLIFRVVFDTGNESAVTITERGAARPAMGFNNYAGRGAESRWQSADGSWFSPRLPHRACYRVEAMGKAGPPDPGLAWRAHTVRPLGRDRWGFDDSAVVTVTTLRQVDAGAAAPAPPTPAPPTPEAADPPPAPRPDATAGAGAGAGAGAARELPQFSPWPPPKPSSSRFIPPKLVTGKPATPTWGSVSDRFDTALANAGYQDLAYYAVPDGFAITTRIERISSNGTPAEDSSRWLGSQAPGKWTLEAALRQLVHAPLGRYRTIVFVFSSAPFTASGAPISEQQAEHWRAGGFNRLPAGLRARAYSADFRCDVLVYEFEQRAAMQPARLVAGGLPVDTHLTRSRILGELEQLP